MDATTAKQLSAQSQISVNYIVRESYELALLKELFDSPFGAHLVFKGGTALRLAYSSPRFSEDLDFDALGEIDSKKFFASLRRIGKRYPAITEVETIAKLHTLFSLVKITEPFLERAFSIKVEVSTRNRPWVKDTDYSSKVITSSTSPLTVLAQVASLDRLAIEKAECA
jgi:predicted nucleotidyltransferase component of viral defense system